MYLNQTHFSLFWNKNENKIGQKGEPNGATSLDFGALSQTAYPYQMPLKYDPKKKKSHKVVGADYGK